MHSETSAIGVNKILIIVLIFLSFWLNQSFAWFEQVDEIKEETNYNKSYKLSLETRKLMNEYYSAMVFEKNDANKIYSKAVSKFEEYKKIRKIISWKYYREIVFKDFIRNTNTDSIIRELWYNKIYYNSYEDRVKSSFFIKEHNIDLSNIKINEKIDGIYLWMNINRIEKRVINSNLKKELPTFRENYLKNIYIKYNSKEISFKKIDLEKFDWKININILKLVKNIKKDERINVQINFYIKKWDSYIWMLRYPINDRFSFSEYDIKSSFEQKFSKENNPNYNKYRNNSVQDKINEKLNNKLEFIFNKIKRTKSEKEYITFLKWVRKRIISFNNNINKYKSLTSWITTIDSYNSSYNKFVEIKNKERIVTLLLVFISEEIYKNELEWTISDFIK